MRGSNPFRKLHESNRGFYTGGIYDKDSLPNYISPDRYGSLYPYMMGTKMRPKHMRSPAGPGIGIDNLGVGG